MSDVSAASSANGGIVVTPQRPLRGSHGRNNSFETKAQQEGARGKTEQSTQQSQKKRKRPNKYYSKKSKPTSFDNQHGGRAARSNWKGAAKSARERKNQRRRQLQKQSTQQDANKVGGPNLVCVDSGSGEEEEEIYYWEIDAIIGRRKKNGILEYLVRWKNCTDKDNTWEPRRNLCDSALREAIKYDQKEKERERQRQIDAKKLGLLEEGDVGDRGGGVAASREGSQKSNGDRQSIDVAPRLSNQIDETNDAFDDELGLAWNDHEQIRFRDVERIDVSSCTSSEDQQRELHERVRTARENGIPVVLTGHSGWAQFATRWMKQKNDSKLETGCSDDSLRACGCNNVNSQVEEEVHDSLRAGGCNVNSQEAHDSLRALGCNVNSHLEEEVHDSLRAGGCNVNSLVGEEVQNKEASGWIDLSDPKLELDVEAMIRDIGDEDVPIVRRNYNESSPIHGLVPASKFLKHSWMQGNKNKLYLHQWQFPLSDTAGRKLCHQSRPLSVLGDDLLSYWLDLEQCKGDSPLQYLFMGREETYSKLHRDNGGLAISIAPIVGRKECTLVHRKDATSLYHLNVCLEKPDLHRYPLLVHARIWRTVVVPGEILLMPEGTFHQCRNLSPCLSYSRFHLDEVNLPGFVRSMFDRDALEIGHDEILWNAASALILKVDAMVDAAQTSLKEGLPVQTLESAEIQIVKTLRVLRHSVRDVARRISVRLAVKGGDPSAMKEFFGSDRDYRSSGKHAGSSQRSKANTSDWDELVDDIDLCLHEFRYRRSKVLPPFRARRQKSGALDNALPLESETHISEKMCFAVAYDTSFEKAYLALPDFSECERQSFCPSFVSKLASGNILLVRLGKKKVQAEVVTVAPQMNAAYLSYEDYPSIYDEYQPIENLRNTDDVETRVDELKPGMIVTNREEDRGAVQFVKKNEAMLRVKYLGLGCDVARWISWMDVLKVLFDAENNAAEPGALESLSRINSDDMSESKVLDLVSLEN